MFCDIQTELLPFCLLNLAAIVTAAQNVRGLDAESDSWAPYHGGSLLTVDSLCLRFHLSLLPSTFPASQSACLCPLSSSPPPLNLLFSLVLLCPLAPVPLPSSPWSGIQGDIIPVGRSRNRPDGKWIVWLSLSRLSVYTFASRPLSPPPCVEVHRSHCC